MTMGFHNRALMKAIAAEFDTVGVNYQNFNIAILDNVKTFVSDIDAFRVPQFSRAETAQ